MCGHVLSTKVLHVQLFLNLKRKVMVGRSKATFNVLLTMLHLCGRETIIYIGGCASPT